MDDSVMVTDKNGRVCYNNKKIEYLLNLPPDKIYGNYIFELFKRKYDSHLSSGFQNTKNGKNYMFEAPMEIGGIKKIILAKMVPIIKPDERINKILIICNDITSRIISEKRVKNTIRKLKKISTEDSLTGLYNKKYFSQRLSQEFERSWRYGNELSLLMIDLDLFKKINDENGHMFGDFILKDIAKIFKKNCRKSDLAFRYGGDEFSIILPDTQYSGAVNFAEKLYRKIRSHNFNKDSKSVNVGISIGISSYNEDKPINKEEFIEFADRALFCSKRVGGGMPVCFFDIKEENIDFESIEKNDTAKARYPDMKKIDNLCESIRVLVEALGERDSYSKRHSYNVMNYAVMIARAMSLGYDDIVNIRDAAILHDIGKIGISDNILLKDSILSDSEMEEIRKHPEIGVKILENIEILKDSLMDIKHHHEWYNGDGYPSGLAGQSIPFKSRIIAVADAFDAMTSERPYRSAMPVDQAVIELIEGMGSQFCPDIICSFLKKLDSEKIMPGYIKIDDAVKRIIKDSELVEISG